ncbi:TetR/AcrR family transcriptional regulator [Desertivirga arenae]|uniref:TetR/AcrR family transcriptional regulator n=1 Tax=Desertivirga arenae TaxID=2810309 RepID=UPI001A9732CB|nr:TetR/AcrR family transcriptional regulator [Pedobacter sp. SYSU D00823]
MDTEKSTEQKILEAAKKVFVAKGMAGARMQDIADEAGINKALLHYYFRSKEKLFEVIFTETVGRFIPRVNEIFSSDMIWSEKIETFASEYIDKVLENPFLPLFVMNEMHKQPEEFLKKMWGGEKPQIETFLRQVKKAVEDKEIRPIHPAHLIMNVMSLCIFPFIGKPMLQMIASINDQQFFQLMEERKVMVPQFIIQSLKL